MTRKMPKVSLLLFPIIPVLLFKFEFIQTLNPEFRYSLIGFGLLLLFLGIAAMLMKRYGWAHIVKWVSVYYLAFTCAIWVVYLVSRIIVFTDVYGMEKLLQDHHAAAQWIYIAICFAQPILLPIPEAVTVVAGSTILGAPQAFFYGFAGTMLGVATMFGLARIGGTRLVSRLVKAEQLERYHQFVRKNEGFIMGLLFVIPVLPDEIVCVGAGVSGVTPRKFLLIAAAAKLATSFLLAYSVQVAEWLSMSPSEVTIALSVAVGVTLLAVFLFKRRMRSQAPRQDNS
ncbi:TVP38/TMEM64 family protein [Cohnella hongkongensis]|uniref:TVP38/TMEM64 family membrane protein n=1 Tax=Cohnella hongkongensis TaxID=178337 RepID=A0ABV9FD47_9BACL